MLKYFDNIFKNDPIITCKDNKLNWCSIYGFSSFSYGILGVIIFIFFQNNFMTEKYGIPIPINIYVLCLIIQSLVTFLADVYYINEESIFHYVDRFVATFNIILFSITIYWVSYIEKIIFVIALMNSLLIFKYSREHRIKRDISSYCYYHSVWHFILPFYILIWLLYREFFIKKTLTAREWTQFYANV